MPTPENLGSLIITEVEIERIGPPGSPAEEPAIAKLVADESARLALSVEAAADFVVIQGSDNSAWVLVADGDPSNAADWVEINFLGDTTLDGGNPNSSYSPDSVDGGTP